MFIGERLRTLRKEKRLSQGDILERTGLLRAYISRVEAGHTIPSIDTMEKFARALEVPLYQLFIDGNETPILPPAGKHLTEKKMWGSSGEDARTLGKFCRAFARMTSADLKLLLLTAHKIERRRKGSSARS
jgi:transcriptional regulator with XRE-family HTH domain